MILVSGKVQGRWNISLLSPSFFRRGTWKVLKLSFVSASYLDCILDYLMKYLNEIFPDGVWGRGSLRDSWTRNNSGKWREFLRETPVLWEVLLINLSKTWWNFAFKSKKCWKARKWIKQNHWWGLQGLHKIPANNNTQPDDAARRNWIGILIKSWNSKAIVKVRKENLKVKSHLCAIKCSKACKTLKSNIVSKYPVWKWCRALKQFLRTILEQNSRKAFIKINKASTTHKPASPPTSCIPMNFRWLTPNGN